MSITNIKKALGKVYPGEWYISRVKSNGLSVVENAADSGMFGVTAETFEAEYIVAVNPAVISEILSTFSAAIEDVLSERRRQIGKGYDRSHDDKHVAGDIINSSWGAIARIYAAQDRGMSGDVNGYRKYLVQAAAQIVAEIERVDRSSTPLNQEG